VSARIVGIDLGTTNTLVAHAGRRGTEVFLIPQLVAPGSVEAQTLFPSCLYAPLEGESPIDPFGDAPWVAGELARRRGAEVPGRFVASAKSWLCHPSVDRTAPILPWGAEDASLPRVSPVDASARYLAHVRRTWDEAFPEEPLALCDVVLTVPASFDEAARELTLEAAARAGLTVHLLEEPQAAFYDYMQREGGDAMHALAKEHGGQANVLVVDVGGGTTDLSLLRVTEDAIERVAVGHHLLLGGDNMDLALAVACEARLGSPSQASGRLDPARFAQLVLLCRAAKEKLLADGGPDQAEIALLGRGAHLVGGAIRTAVTREECEKVVLDGFFPIAPRDAKPERTRSALVAWGLPYERDVAITRHVAWFFARHAPPEAHPHALLVNGGVFRGARVTERLVRAIEAWGGPRLRVLPQPDPHLGVARGAVAYGLARKGELLKIGGGSPRAFYVAADGGAVCVVPRGAEEGVVHRPPGRTFALTVGRPARFELYASDERDDPPGAVVPIDEETMARLPPLATVFAAGQKPREVNVALEGELTAIGTLDLACVEIDGEKQRFRLAFQLRPGAASSSRAPPLSSVPPKSRPFEAAVDATARVFGKRAEAAKDLPRELEKLLGERPAWTLDVTRSLYDVLVQNKGARRRSADHERVFWSLAGWCLRPGFGETRDAERISFLAPLFAERLAFPAEARGWAQFWIAWRRVAGGLSDETQTQMRDVLDPYVAPTEAGLKKSKKLTPHAPAEMLELVSWLERVPAVRRGELGEWIVEKTWLDTPTRAHLWAALGRIGARVPAYASAHHVVAPLTVERWLERLLREKWNDVPTAAEAAARMARRTDDRARDIGDRMRREIEKRLAAAHAPEAWVRAVREHALPDENDRDAWLGEGLPVGLRLVD
jgi:molecular chaperone DnaK (HSP70)